MLPAIMIAAAVVGGVGKMDASKKAKRASFASAKAFELQAAEDRRRTQRAMDRDLGEAKAATYASNIQMSGSNSRFIEDMQQEHVRTISWMTMAAEKQASAIRKGAAVTKTASDISAGAGMVSGATGAASSWWSK